MTIDVAETEREALWSPDADTMPWSRMLEEQLGGVERLFDRLRTHSVWADRLAGVPRIDHYDALLDVPFTVKEDLRAAQAHPDPERPLGDFQLVPTEELRQITSSSGTTGAPVFFGLTTHDRERWSHAIANAYRTAGVAPGRVVALTTGMPIVAGGMPYADGIREAGGALVWSGGQTTSRMALAMQRLAVDTLVCTASFATHFAERCAEELGVPADELYVKRLICGGEPGAGVPQIRERMLQAWGAGKVSELMGLGDVLPAMWAECWAGRGMHFTAAPDVLVELIDPETQEHIPWEPGATGEAVYTTVSREASAIVRFRSRDQLLVTGVECPCGRTAPTVRCVGRTDDMLIYKAMNVYPSAIREVVLDLAAPLLTGTMRVRKDSADQVRFDDPIPLELEFLDDVDAARRAEAIAGIEEAIRSHLRVRVGVEVLPAGTIPVGSYKNALAYVRE